MARSACVLPSEIDAAQLEALWNDLAATDAKKAGKAQKAARSDKKRKRKRKETYSSYIYNKEEAWATGRAAGISRARSRAASSMKR